MAMKRPEVVWYWDYIDEDSNILKYDKVGLKDGKGESNMWDLGVVKAGNVATSDDTIQTFYIWNNKGGREAIQTMTNCTLTIRDGKYTDGSYNEGNADSLLVRERWIQARTFKSIKGNAEKEQVSRWIEVGLKDDGSIAEIAFEALGRKDKDTTDTFGTQQISGGINTGNFEDDICRNNYAKIQLKMIVPPDADAGEVAFIARIHYSSAAI